MLLKKQKQAVAQAWLDRCKKDADLRGLTHVCNAQCRDYFSHPLSLLWPFAAGVLLIRFKSVAPQLIKASSVGVSLVQLAAKAAPLARQWIK
ncbi:hypothetical protein [Granulosicoccus antarcticus]|uniref:Uncharacterized protein n=1 Tax=Granulosicoccus antarcticus IMCC3135 TaxID=1192854 RepID=A0A2Z2NZ50_9GAMM|nr:hypothetical protein [Granulosicoccus antarcticus]ASJ73057.1 hypothetical protein IMCC3135_14860 [Granulosicoccus antarcticus IMCC3135]